MKYIILRDFLKCKSLSVSNCSHWAKRKICSCFLQELNELFLCTLFLSVFYGSYFVYLLHISEQYMLNCKQKGRNKYCQKYACQFVGPHLSPFNGLDHLNQWKSCLLLFKSYWDLMATVQKLELSTIIYYSHIYYYYIIWHLAKERDEKSHSWQTELLSELHSLFDWSNCSQLFTYLVCIGTHQK